MRQQRSPKNDAQRDARTRWRARRVLAWFVTLALHLGVLAFMLRTPTPLLMSRTDTHSTDALQLRFIETSSVPPAPPRVTPRLAPPPKAPSRPRAAKPPAPRPVVSTTPASLPTPLAAAPQDQQRPAPGPDYVEGGRGFAQSLRDANGPTVRLPGELSPHATRFRMADPADTGLRHVANIIKGMAGGEDTACLDAESADGLTPQQQLAQGMSMRVIKRAAAAQGCIPLDRLRTMKQAPMAAPTLR